MNLKGPLLSAFFLKCFRFITVVVLMSTCCSVIYAQRAIQDSLMPPPVSLEDSVVSLPPNDETVVTPDSLSSQIALTDSLKTSDTMSVADKEKALGIQIAKDALPAAVVTTAKDSAILDLEHHIFFLFGDAQANYNDVEVKGGVIEYQQKNNLLTAAPEMDTSGAVISMQQFTQGTEKFTYDTLRYNFVSKRALVLNARSQYGEGFVYSDLVKRNADGSISGGGNLYTTCDLPHPHFGIRAKKIKVIPGRIIASGPANLEIEDVPTPLMLPFGLFPIKQGQHSGFILPTYTLEDNKGVGLLGMGYYFALNDYIGLITKFDVYSRGSWGAIATAQYANRYHYTGSFSVNYIYSQIGESYDLNSQTSKDFQVDWSHQVDPKARPGTSFNASVHFGTSTFNQNNEADIHNVLDNQYSSSISYGKTWVGKPYSLTVALRHSQSTQTHQVTVGLPSINFSVGQFTPFHRKVQTGTPTWYEKISVSYSVRAENNWNFIDSNLSLNNLSYRDFDNGIQQSASVQANYNVLRYFTWSINMPYTEYWNTKQVFYNYNATTGRIDTTVNAGFFTSRDFNLTSSLSTRIYGVKMFRKGKIMGIRHVLSPSISATYQPGFAHPPFEYMYENRWGPDDYPQFSSPYSRSPIGGPSNPDNRGTVSFSLGNTLQMKVRTDDSVGSKNISLIDGLNLNTGYDLFADSFNMQDISLNFRTSILNKINISASASFDPYVYKNGRRTPEYLIKNGGGLAKFRNGNMSIGLNFRGERKDKGNLEEAAKNNDEVNRLLQNGGYDDYYDFNIPWNLNVNAGLSAYRQYRTEGLPDTMIVRPNMTFSGGFNLTERWKVNVSSGFEFVGFDKVRMGTTNIDISRDLHCWQMSLNLVPFGYYRSFRFTLQVKASVLQDLKLTRRRSYYDNPY